MGRRRQACENPKGGQGERGLRDMERQVFKDLPSVDHSPPKEPMQTPAAATDGPGTSARTPAAGSKQLLS